MFCLIPLYTIAYPWTRFLLAQLHVDSLLGKTTKKAIRSILEKLPKGSTALNKAYDEAIEGIEGQSLEKSALAKSIIS